jgi:hypothetical protein
VDQYKGRQGIVSNRDIVDLVLVNVDITGLEVKAFTRKIPNGTLIGESECHASWCDEYP